MSSEISSFSRSPFSLKKYLLHAVNIVMDSIHAHGELRALHLPVSVL
jgi:hypothetical protein